MSAAQPVAAPIPPPPVRRPRLGRTRRSPARRALSALAGVGLLALAVWGAWRLYALTTAAAPPAIPTATVQLGEVRLDVFAKGTLKGGRSELLVAPPVAGGPLSIQFLRPSGDLVHKGDVVVKFDTATQEYNLTQAREALEQARQQVAQAQATAQAQTEDDAYQLQKAQFDVERAQLQVRRNPTLAAVDAKKNDLALAAAQEHLKQLQGDAASRAAGNTASIAVQQAAQRKAEADAATAQHNIASMTMTAQQDGYVSVRQNTSTNILFAGMALPAYQVGDTIRPGQAVVEIPDTNSWEVDLQVSEQDAGHLAPGNPVNVEFVALPGQNFAGKLQSVGAASGQPWNRQVECVVTLPHPTPALRPGLSATAVVTTAVLAHVLWAPSQAVFDSGGSSYVYRLQNGQFHRENVTVMQRSESQVVLRGLQAGDAIALANPENRAPAGARSSKPAGGAAAALGGGR